MLITLTVSSCWPTGEKPTFAAEPYEHGMGQRIVHSKALWTK